MKNLSQFGPAVWAVGGVAIDFGQCTSYISGTSVENIRCGFDELKNGMFIRLASSLLRRHGGIDVLINNAGVSYSSTVDVEEKSVAEVWYV